jgi:hypothetical protein
MHGVWPADVIDHINGNPLDNRIENLREATQAQNLGNCKKRVDNTSGHKGVATVWNGSWRATIRGRHLGTFATKEQAQTAYANAAEREFGAFAKVV